MFDLRYHVASLVAVFVALIVGILVGVGLAGSGVTKKADLKAAQFQRDEANKKLDASRAQVADLQKTQKAFQDAYPAVMRNLLTERRIGVLYIGSVDSGVNKSIADTLQDAGAGQATRMLSLSVPVDAENVDNLLFGKGPKFVKYVATTSSRAWAMRWARSSRREVRLRSGRRSAAS